jgi:GH43 family beta-xylosidase
MTSPCTHYARAPRLRLPLIRPGSKRAWLTALAILLITTLIPLLSTTKPSQHSKRDCDTRFTVIFSKQEQANSSMAQQLQPNWPAHAQSRYNDTILTITNSSCADPYVLWDKGTYYMTFTCGGHIEIWSADSLFDFEKKCKKNIIWRPPPDQPYSADLWAPELHSIHGRWYVYFAADDPKHGNKSHRMYVLAGPPAEEDLLEPSKWNFFGRMAGLPEDQWAIDGTVITLGGSMLFAYSGWPFGTSANESRQEIYIIEMVSATECTGHPIRISTPDLQFEFSGSSGINEGPQFLASPDGRWMGIVYSCAGSWTHEYKMNIGREAIRLTPIRGPNPTHRFSRPRGMTLRLTVQDTATSSSSTAPVARKYGASSMPPMPKPGGKGAKLVSCAWDGAKADRSWAQASADGAVEMLSISSKAVLAGSVEARAIVEVLEVRAVDFWSRVIRVGMRRTISRGRSRIW